MVIGKRLEDLGGDFGVLLLKRFKFFLDLISRLAHERGNERKVASVLLKVTPKHFDFLFSPDGHNSFVSFSNSLELDFTSRNTSCNR